MAEVAALITQLLAHISLIFLTESTVCFLYQPILIYVEKRKSTFLKQAYIMPRSTDPLDSVKIFGDQRFDVFRSTLKYHRPFSPEKSRELSFQTLLGTIYFL